MLTIAREIKVARHGDQAMSSGKTCRILLVFVSISLTSRGENQKVYAQACPQWVEVTPKTQPSFYGPAVYDSVRDVVVMYSGEGTVPPQPGQTWEWNGTDWSLRSSNGPPLANGYVLAFDSARGVTVFFGGVYMEPPNTFIHLNETWEWNGNSWTMRANDGPSGREDAAMTFDSSRRRIILHGGARHVQPQYQRDTWEWDGFSWVLASNSGPSRAAHTITYDSHRDVCVLFGGFFGTTQEDTWEWNGTVWTMVEDGSMAPPRRLEAGATYDPGRRAVMIFGGSNAPPADTWMWNGQSWSQVFLFGPSSRINHSLLFDLTEYSPVLLGGIEPGLSTPVADPHWILKSVASFPSSAAQAEKFPPCESPSTYAKKNRVISFVPPQVPLGAEGVALRVTIDSLSDGSACEVPDYSSLSGAQMWVGPETLFAGEPTGAFRLQDSPLFRDWTTIQSGVVHLTDCNIIPCATYHVESISDVNYPDGLYSVPLQLNTSTAWGDVVGTNSSLPANDIVNISDIAGLVDCFKEIPGAPPKSWCDLQRNGGQMILKINIGDVALGVDAFKGHSYSAPGPTAPSPCP